MRKARVAFPQRGETLKARDRRGLSHLPSDLSRWGGPMISEKEVPETRRREIFQAIVEAQDRVSVAQSRNEVARRFGVNEGQVRQIEREGIENSWPPL